MKFLKDKTEKLKGKRTDMKLNCGDIPSFNLCHSENLASLWSHRVPENKRAGVAEGIFNKVITALMRMPYFS